MCIKEPFHSADSKERPPLEVADIFFRYGEAYRQSHVLTEEQHKVMWDIEHCRTAVLGGHLDVCDVCGYERPSYNSCLNRHCPKCQSLSQAKWIAERKQRILNTHYFHVVFTLPHELASLARSNPKIIYDLLFSSAGQTLMEFGKRRLKAQLGITAVLHTWTRQMLYHPHVHLICTGGGLADTQDSWVSASDDYLFPVQLLSTVFRGKFLTALKKRYDKKELLLEGATAVLQSPQKFYQLIDQLYQKEWVVFAKRPFGGPQQVFNYLGRYTHRVAISNHRLVSMDDEGICFATKNGETVTVSPQEFIRRFLLHVLPKGFYKIRHFGLLASRNSKSKLEIARRLLGGQSNSEIIESKDWSELYQDLTGTDLSQCPRCKQGKMIRSQTIPKSKQNYLHRVTAICNSS